MFELFMFIAFASIIISVVVLLLVKAATDVKKETRMKKEINDAHEGDLDEAQAALKSTDSGEIKNNVIENALLEATLKSQYDSELAVLKEKHINQEEEISLLKTQVELMTTNSKKIDDEDKVEAEADTDTKIDWGFYDSPTYSRHDFSSRL